MKRRILLPILAIALITAGAAFAQQFRHGTGTPPSGPPSVIAGTVLNFTAAAGTGMPSLAVSRAEGPITLVLGPFWFLQNAQFSAIAGDRVELVVLACPDCASGFAVVSVKNLTNGKSVTLRNAEGLPLWQSPGQRGGGRGTPGQPGTGWGNGPGNGPRNGRGNGPGTGPGNGPGDCNGVGPDMTQVATFSGTVSSFTGGPGIGRPTLVLSTAAGEKTFLVAPYRVVLEAGLVLEPGASLTLTAAPNVNEEWVVVTLKDNATGAELVLRDAQTGLPANGGRRGRC